MGDHIRKVRLDRKLSQPKVAKMIGVSTDCITNWELNRFCPKIKYHPGIVSFLGYDPTVYGDQNSLANQVLSYRKKYGLSIKRFAKLWSMDEKTICRIEGQERVFDSTIAKVKENLKHEL